MRVRPSNSSHPTTPATTCPTNRTLFQGFEWYTPSSASCSHWTRLQRVLPALSRIGITALWIPPACKATSPRSNGYDIYDLYDLGEFEWKNSRATKWGTKEQLQELVRVADAEGVEVLFDAVLNHRAGADRTEVCRAVEVDPKDRTKEISPPDEVEVWTGFDFPARHDKYSSTKLTCNDFSGTGWDQRTGKKAIFKFVGENKQGWAEDVCHQFGNFDYLLCEDVDYSQQNIRQDTLHWGEWVTRELGISGMRLDAVKHYSEGFVREFIANLDAKLPKKLFIVGEYWTDDVDLLSGFITRFKGRMSLVDPTLLSNFSYASSARSYDLRQIFKGTLCELHPENVVTFVQNHDTQETQTMESPVEEWFVALAYALILLRNDSGYPCVFYGDLYGIKGRHARPPRCGGKLPNLVLVRKLYAYGPQHDYFDDASCIGWTREGHQAQSGGNGCAVVMTNGWECAVRRMYVGIQHAGETWKDVMRWAWGVVEIDANGWGSFPVGHRSLSVWVSQNVDKMPWLEAIKL